MSNSEILRIEDYRQRPQMLEGTAGQKLDQALVNELTQESHTAIRGAVYSGLQFVNHQGVEHRVLTRYQTDRLKVHGFLDTTAGGDDIDYLQPEPYEGEFGFADYGRLTISNMEQLTRRIGGLVEQQGVVGGELSAPDAVDYNALAFRYAVSDIASRQIIQMLDVDRTIQQKALNGERQSYIDAANWRYEVEHGYSIGVDADSWRQFAVAQIRWSLVSQLLLGEADSFRARGMPNTGLAGRKLIQGLVDIGSQRLDKLDTISSEDVARFDVEFSNGAAMVSLLQPAELAAALSSR